MSHPLHHLRRLREFEREMMLGACARYEVWLSRVIASEDAS